MKVEIMQRKPTELICKKIIIDDSLKDLDLYEKVALKFGWKKDIDALWFLSTKGIIKLDRVEDDDVDDYNYCEPKKPSTTPVQQTFAFEKPIIYCIEKINN